MNEKLAALIEDVEFMIATGESAQMIANRTGYRTDTLQRRLQRAGRHDLVRAAGLGGRDDRRAAA